MQEPIVNSARDIVAAAYAQNRSPAVQAGLLLAFVLALLAALPLLPLMAGVPHGASEASEAGPPAARAFVSDRDTINGYRIADPEIRARIERIAAAVPAHLLAGNRRATQVRYLAQAFGTDDDAAISYGVFQEPAAALAFGCAMDDQLAGGCALSEPNGPQAAYEDIPGVRCEPMGIALGAPAYEPDRCEAHG